MRLLSNYALSSFLCAVNGMFSLLYTLTIAQEYYADLAVLRYFLFLINFILPLLAIYFAFTTLSLIKKHNKAYKGTTFAFLGMFGGFLLILFLLLNFRRLT